MTRLPLAAMLAAACLAACAVTATGTRDDAAQRARIEGLADAERGFAAAATHGVKAAFLDAMADDATLFRPGPVDGKAFFAARPEPPFRLAWQPTRVAVAASGELGYSSGPWRLTRAADPAAPVTGHFFTVWRRADDGRWRVLIDHGAGGPGAADARFDALVGDGSRARRSVADAESTFAQATAADGLSAAYRANGSAAMRLLREDLAPIDGLDDVARMPDGGAHWTWTTTDSATSSAADFAWTMGRYRTEGTEGAGGAFVRVWRSEGGTWKILGDVLAPNAETNQ